MKVGLSYFTTGEQHQKVAQKRQTETTEAHRSMNLRATGAPNVLFAMLFLLLGLLKHGGSGFRALLLIGCEPFFFPLNI